MRNMNVNLTRIKTAPSEINLTKKKLNIYSIYFLLRWNLTCELWHFT